MSEKKKPMTPYEFYQSLHKMHYLYKVQEELSNWQMIDKTVEIMGNDLPEAEYIIQKIQRRLKNDRKY